MNVVILMGRLTSDPKVTYTETANGPMAIARYRLAVDRGGRKQNGESNADFITCVAFGRQGEFAEKYMTKGRKFLIRGRIQTGSYTNREGQKVYTTEIMVDAQEFADAKPEGQGQQERAAAPAQQAYTPPEDDFVAVPDDIDEELPFN